jgi:hypothetical protein
MLKLLAAVSDRHRRSEIDATIPALREHRFRVMRKNWLGVRGSIQHSVVKY